MAMELHVLSDRRLSAVGEWQHAIDIEGYPLRLDGDTQPDAVDGFVPAEMNGQPTGFECFNDKAHETMKFLGNDQFDRRWKYALGFRWRGSSFEELQAAWMAAIAYAAATGGIIFDHEEGRVFTPQQGREQVAKFVSESPRIKARLEDIKKRFSKKS
jgi:hypothetical protein